MSGTVEELVARLSKAQKRLSALEARERPLALRGWRDDFLGDSIHEQYTAVSNGAGSGGALQNNAHGGVYRLTAGAGAGFYHRLYLGDAAGNYNTLDCDYGWTMIARMELSSIAANVQASIGALAGDFVQVGYDGATSANWLVWTRVGGVGASTASAVAADTDPHVHRIMASAGRIDYWLDGALIATHTASVPIIPMTPFCHAYSSGGTISLDLDYWAVIPMNLA